MFQCVHVSGYKSFLRASTKLSKVHALVGPNDSGKSSFLEIVRQLSNLSSREPHGIAQNLRVGRIAPLTRTATDNLSDGTIFQFSVPGREANSSLEYSFKLEVSPDGENYKGLAYHKMVVPNRGEIVLPRDITLVTIASQGLAARTVAINPEDRSVLEDSAKLLLTHIEGARIMRFDPALLKMSAATSNQPPFSLHPTGFGLPQLFDDLLGYDRSLVDSIEEEMRSLIAGFKRIQLKRDQGFQVPPEDSDLQASRQAAGKALWFEFEEFNAPISAAQVSDGLMILLAYVALQRVPKPATILLIEEPENGIHPKRLEEIVLLLRKSVQRSSKRQVIFTTHSPFLLNNMAPEEVTICRKSNGETQMLNLSDSKLYERLKKSFTVGEIWSAEGEDRLSE